MSSAAPAALRPVTSTGSVIAALRIATAGRHDAIERLLDLDADFDRSHYERVIAGFGAFVQQWEPVIAGALPERLHGWFATRSRHAFLTRDLAALGAPSAPARAASAARLQIDGAAAAWGSLYVIEGSALGGQVIARRVAATLGITPASGSAYFAGWGADTGARWRAFCERLEAEVGGASDARERACTGARDTFDALLRTFQVVLNESIAY